MIDETSPPTSIDGLPTVAREQGLAIYDPQDPQIQEWLKQHWVFGYNPLAAARAYSSTAMQLTLPSGEFYSYTEPNHSFDHYRKNKEGEEPQYLGHITQAGWVEYALKQHGGKIGKEVGIWMGAWDPQRWWPGKFPEGFSFEQPPERFVELIFDAQRLRETGIVAECIGDSDYYHFKERLPLNSLVATSKAYLTQVLNLPIDVSQ